jgi:hypothetical protein
MGESSSKFPRGTVHCFGSDGGRGQGGGSGGDRNLGGGSGGGQSLGGGSGGGFGEWSCWSLRVSFMGKNSSKFLEGTVHFLFFLGLVFVFVCFLFFVLSFLELLLSGLLSIPV